MRSAGLTIAVAIAYTSVIDPFARRLASVSSCSWWVRGPVRRVPLLTHRGPHHSRLQLGASPRLPREELLAGVRQGVETLGGPEAAAAWSAVAKEVASASAYSTDEAEEVLASAFGWKGWVELKQPVYLKPKWPPAAPRVQKALAWLREGPLAFRQEEIRNALAVKPIPYLTNPAKYYEKSRATAPYPWQTADAYRDLLTRHPQALQLVWNCELTDPAERGLGLEECDIHCDGKCTNCWRTATPKLKGEVLDGVEV